MDFLEQWNKLSLGLKFLLLLVVWALMGVGYYFLFFEEQQNQLNRLAQQFRTIRKKRDKHEVIARNLPRWQSEVSRLKGELAKALTLLPNQKELPSLLRKIDNLALKSGLEISRIEFLREKKRSFYSEVPFRLVLLGNFHEVMVFFDKVSNLDRIVNITRINMGNPSTKNQKLLLGVRCLGTTFRFLSTRRKKRKKKRRR